MGFKQVRIDISWGNIEKTAGVFNFSEVNARVQDILDRGMTPILILDYNNSLYASSTRTGIVTDENRTAFGNFAEKAAQNFKGKGVIFEIWNEPNHPAFWTPEPNAEHFAKLLPVAVSKIRAVDSSYRIVSGGLAEIDLPYLNTLINKDSLGGIDCIGIHPYAHANPEKVADIAVAATSLLKARGITSPLCTTEVGATSAWYGDGSTDANRYRQANILTRGILSSWAANDPSHVIYRLRDIRPGQTYSTSDYEANFGLFDQYNYEKPAKWAVDTVFAAARNRTYQGLITASPSSLQAMKFSSPGQETVYAVWTNAAKGSTTFTALDKCDRTRDFFGKPSVNASCVVNFLGTSAMSLCTKTGMNSRLTCTVKQSDSPIFVRMATE